MKKLNVTLLAIAALTAPVLHAADSDKDEPSCKNNYKIAKTLMDARQSGVPLMLMLDTFPAFEAYIEDAYQVPAYNTPSVQQQAIEEFAEEKYFACKRAGN